MTERPILFSAPMVRAILAGAKVQTRRVVNPEPAGSVTTIYRPFAHEPNNWQGYADNVGFIRWYGRCRYGQPGDRLWVRETWAVPHRYDHLGPSNIPVLGVRTHYAATEERGGLRWRPSIHMPRWASRITLEITAVRVERLQDISEADAKAEGAEPYLHPVHPAREQLRHVDGFQALWESINGPDSWDLNPWVWVVEFKRVG